MEAGFKKFKKRNIMQAVVKSLVLGVPLALLVVGALLLIFKLGGVDFHFAYYILIGAVVAVLSCGGFFALFKKNDKKLAEELDESYNLGERVQTMLAFSDKTDGIAAIQRAEAEERLSSVKVKRLSIKELWQYVLCAVLCLAVFFTAVFLPARTASADDPFDNTKWHIEALNALIAEVKSSELDEPLKLTEVAALEDFASGVNTAETVSQVKALAKTSVISIKTATDAADSFTKLAPSLLKNEYTSPLSSALLSGAAYYKADGVPQDFAGVKTAATGREEKISAIVTPATSSLATEVSGKNGAEQTETILYMGEAISAAISESGLAQNDGFVTALNAFQLKLNEAYAVSGSSLIMTQGRMKILNPAVERLEKEITPVLSVQAYNCLMYDYVTGRLATIYGFTLNELLQDNDDGQSGGNQGGTTDDGNGDDGDKDGDDENDSVHGGGFAEGGKGYGADEEIYDPDLGEYVKYRELLAKYEALKDEQLSNAEYEEQLKKLIQDYFMSLRDASEKDEQP